ncbi:hypothetical protein EAF00_007662 [Botryotinia globosa]|nr:hypothetical protein EAF00_007662 [Botryotinia globosa]
MSISLLKHRFRHWQAIYLSRHTTIQQLINDKNPKKSQSSMIIRHHHEQSQPTFTRPTIFTTTKRTTPITPTLLPKPLCLSISVLLKGLPLWLETPLRFTPSSSSTAIFVRPGNATLVDFEAAAVFTIDNDKHGIATRARNPKTGLLFSVDLGGLFV